MSLYLDGSVLVKVLVDEPDSSRVADLIEAESELIVSSLARLEALMALDARHAGGLSQRQVARRKEGLEKLLSLPAFRLVPCPASIFETAELQLGGSYCPTLDRLHLAVMAEFKIQRLLTNDLQQARAARALGFEVVPVASRENHTEAAREADSLPHH
jgi:predicted nucleic acid-binding protein